MPRAQCTASLRQRLNGSVKGIKRMRIAMVGAGGVGGYFGGLLAAAGADVTFVARGAHLAALRRDGLSIESPVRPIAGLEVQATDDPSTVGIVDQVVIAVKLWDLEAAAEAARPMIGPDTAIVSFQNGVDAADRLAAIYGAGPVLGGVCHIGASIGRPGVIAHVGKMAKLTVGELDGRPSVRLQRFADACTAAGIEFHASGNVHRAIWEKFVFLSAFSGITALARSPIGPLRAVPAARAALYAAMAEGVAVARAHGGDLPPDHADKVITFIDGLAPAMKSSMLHDLERGARLELPWLSGAVVRLGAEKGVPTPTHSLVSALLTPYADGPLTA